MRRLTDPAEGAAEGPGVLTFCPLDVCSVSEAELCLIDQHRRVMRLERIIAWYDNTLGPRTPYSQTSKEHARLRRCLVDSGLHYPAPCALRARISPS